MPAPGGSSSPTCSARAAKCSSVSAGADHSTRSAQQQSAQHFRAGCAARLARAQHRHARRASASASRRACVDLPAPSPPSSVMNRPGLTRRSRNATAPPSRGRAGRAAARRSPASSGTSMFGTPSPRHHQLPERRTFGHRRLDRCVIADLDRGLLPPVARHRHHQIAPADQRHGRAGAQPYRHALHHVAGGEQRHVLEIRRTPSPSAARFPRRARACVVMPFSTRMTRRPSRSALATSP